MNPEVAELNRRRRVEAYGRLVEWGADKTLRSFNGRTVIFADGDYINLENGRGQHRHGYLHAGPSVKLRQPHGDRSIAGQMYTANHSGDLLIVNQSEPMNYPWWIRLFRALRR